MITLNDYDYVKFLFLILITKKKKKLSSVKFFYIFITHIIYKQGRIKCGAIGQLVSGCKI